jgi:hypothetical protein
VNKPLCPFCAEPLRDGELITTVLFPSTGTRWVQHIICPGDEGYERPPATLRDHLLTAFGVVCGIFIVTVGLLIFLGWL